jgi:hypothetical protein
MPPSSGVRSPAGSTRRIMAAASVSSRPKARACPSTWRLDLRKVRQPARPDQRRPAGAAAHDRGPLGEIRRTDRSADQARQGASPDQAGLDRSPDALRLPNRPRRRCGSRMPRERPRRKRSAPARKSSTAPAHTAMAPMRSRANGGSISACCITAMAMTCVQNSGPPCMMDDPQRECRPGKRCLPTISSRASTPIC